MRRAIATVALVSSLAVTDTCAWCQFEDCSNDWTILGDEAFCFDNPGDDDIVYYQIWEARTARFCAISFEVQQPTICVQMAGSECIAHNDTAVVTVRACDALQCGPFSEPVEYLPWVCIEGSTEVPCYEGAWCRLPEERGCSGPREGAAVPVEAMPETLSETVYLVGR